jgi:hypothetical protein
MNFWRGISRDCAQLKTARALEMWAKKKQFSSFRNWKSFCLLKKSLEERRIQFRSALVSKLMHRWKAAAGESM